MAMKTDDALKDPGTGARGPTLPWCMLVAAGLVVSQVALAMVLSGKGDLVGAYRSLYCWDGDWYRSIVEKGYYSPPEWTPGEERNVAFFPGYPLLAGFVARLFHLDAPTALVLTAQLACWGFWTYFLLLCHRGGGPRWPILWMVLILALYPASYYLVASYSESLFLLCTLGFIYWSDRPGPTAYLLAAVHGFVMTATRLVGVPLVVYPLLRAWLCRPENGSRTWAALLRRSVAPLLVGVLASLGAASYFAFCQVRFGQWDLYMKAEEVGWMVKPDYFALFSWRTYNICFAFTPEGELQTCSLDGGFALVFLLLFITLLVVEFRLRHRPGMATGQRLALYFCAWSLFYIPLCAAAPRVMSSMVRFLLCVYVVLALAVQDLLGRLYPAGPPRWLRVLLLGWLTISFLSLLVLAWRFTHGQWVA